MDVTRPSHNVVKPDKVAPRHAQAVCRPGSLGLYISENEMFWYILWLYTATIIPHFIVPDNSIGR